MPNATSTPNMSSEGTMARSDARSVNLARPLFAASVLSSERKNLI